MQVNSIKSQSFGANPSNAIRLGLAKAHANGKNVTELLGLIKEVHPEKYMTMLEEDGKVFAVGLTDVIDIKAVKNFRENPKFLKERRILFEKFFGQNSGHPSPIIRTSANQTKSQGINFLHVDREQLKGTKIKERWAEFTKKEQELRNKYPKINIIEEPSFEEYGYISLFRNAKGKKFENIMEVLSSALRKIRDAKTPEERALDWINSKLPAYERFATLDELSEETNRMSKTYVPEPRIGDHSRHIL